MAYLAVRGNPFDQLFDFRRDFDGMFIRLLTGRVAPGAKEAEDIHSCPRRLDG